MNGSKMTDHLKGTLDLNTKLNLDEHWQPSRLDPKGKLLVLDTSERLEESKGLVADFAAAFTGNQLERLRLIFSRKPDA